MNRQLKGIALILFSMVLMIGFGNAYFFDLSCRWSAVFAVLGFAGLMVALLPDKKK